MACPRLAVIGAGIFGEMHLRAFKQLERDGRAELVAVADLNEDLLKERQKAYEIPHVFTDHREMLEKVSPDGVSVVTPDFLHKALAIDALNAGAHVLVEKPMDTTVDGCREMREASEKNQKILMVDFHKRYDPYHRELESLVASGKVGLPEYGYAWMEDRIEVPHEWFPHWAPKSSPAWFLGVHMYDLIRWVVKSNGAKVFATGQRKKLPSLGVDTWDAIEAHIVFENGASFTVQSSWILPKKFEAIVNQGIRIVGAEGIIEVDSQNRGGESCFAGEGMATYNLGFFKEDKDKAGNTLYSGYGIESIQDFALNVEHLLNSGTMADIEGKYAGPDDGLEVTKIAVGVHKSLDEGRIIDLTEL